jgi:hypothetical protein
VVVAVDDFVEDVNEERGQVDVTYGGGRLRGSEVEVAADFVQGADVGVDGNEAVAKVGVGSG